MLPLEITSLSDLTPEQRSELQAKHPQVYAQLSENEGSGASAVPSARGMRYVPSVIPGATPTTPSPSQGTPAPAQSPSAGIFQRDSGGPSADPGTPDPNIGGYVSLEHGLEAYARGNLGPVAMVKGLIGAIKGEKMPVDPNYLDPQQLQEAQGIFAKAIEQGKTRQEAARVARDIAKHGFDTQAPNPMQMGYTGTALGNAAQPSVARGRSPGALGGQLGGGSSSKSGSKGSSGTGGGFGGKGAKGGASSSGSASGRSPGALGGKSGGGGSKGSSKGSGSPGGGFGGKGAKGGGGGSSSSGGRGGGGQSPGAMGGRL